MDNAFAAHRGPTHEQEVAHVKISSVKSDSTDWAMPILVPGGYAPLQGTDLPTCVFTQIHTTRARINGPSGSPTLSPPV